MRTARLGWYDVWIPECRSERRRGLLGLRALPPGQGLLLERCRSVHTIGMRFTIDAVLLDRRWHVVGVVRMTPGRVLRPRTGVRHILEVPAGVVPRLGLRLVPRDPGTMEQPDV